MTYRPVIRRLPWLLLLCSAAAGFSATPAPTTVRVLSFNIWLQGGLSLSRSIEAIRASGADVIGLQECNAGTAQTIASQLGLFSSPDGDASILSRFPILETLQASGGRGVCVQIAPGRRAYVFNCHLPGTPYGPYDLQAGRPLSFILAQEQQTRMVSLTNLLKSMAPYLARGEPCFLTGDFNSPSHLDYAAVPWPVSLACLAAGMGDSYREQHPANRIYSYPFTQNEPGITWTPLAAQEPNGVFDRIDFVYYSLGDGVTVSNSTELDARNSVNPWPSNHRAVLSTFIVPAPALGATPAAPVPMHGATGIDLNPTLSWLPASNALRRTVHFWTNVPGVSFTNLTTTTVTPGPLLPGTVYFWRVDEVLPSGTDTGEIWSFTTRTTNVAGYEWSFASGDLAPALGHGVMSYADGTGTAAITSFGVADGSAVPQMNGQRARYLRFPAFASRSNGYHLTFPDTGPNGGGGHVNQYTLVLDVLMPGPIGWFPFFNTNPQNANDADFHAAPDGSLGVDGIGYSAPGVITTNTWYRIAFAADLAAGRVTYYVNGLPVHTGAASLDGRHALYSNLDPGPDLLLFNEGLLPGAYTHAGYVSSVYFTGRTLSASEVLALGGARWWGIAVPEPLHLSILRSSAQVQLDWHGGRPPYQLQTSRTMKPAEWENLGPATNVTRALINPADAFQFFRVIGP